MVADHDLPLQWCFKVELVFSSADDRICVDEGYIKIINLNVEQYLLQFVEKAKSLIFIGGTLEPRSEYQPLRAQALKTFEFSANHVVPPEHTFARTVSHSLDGKVQLDFRSTSRYQEHTLQALKAYIEFLRTQLTFNCGMVVFFPSFDFIKKFRDKFYPAGAPVPTPQRTGAGSSQVFAEERGGNAEQLLRDFEGSTKVKQCMLFAVVGGKVSEGINFRDDMCRCVVVVGLPYPNPQDPVLLEKMKYLDNVAKQRNKPGHAQYLTGKDYYQMRCMKAVNQCIGRAIRHKGDWASITKNILIKS